MVLIQAQMHHRLGPCSGGNQQAKASAGLIADAQQQQLHQSTCHLHPLGKIKHVVQVLV